MNARPPFITSNRDVTKLCARGDPLLAAAAMDRFLHGATSS
jgi:hypothetical protein